MVLEFGLIKNGLFPESEAVGDGVNGDYTQEIVNGGTQRLLGRQIVEAASTITFTKIPNNRRLLLVIEGDGSVAQELRMTWNQLTAGYDYCVWGFLFPVFAQGVASNAAYIVATSGGAGGSASAKTIARLILGVGGAVGAQQLTCMGLMTGTSSTEGYVLQGTQRTTATGFTEVKLTTSAGTFSGTVTLYVMNDEI